MKFFKTTDEKLADLGYKKLKEDRFGASYLDENKAPGFIHIVDLLHKSNTWSILQSYDKYLMDENKIGCVCVGLNYKELKLFTKKMKELGFHKLTRI